MRAHGSRRAALLQSDICATPVCALEHLLTRSADAVQEYISQHGYRQLLGTYRGNYGEDDGYPEENVSKEVVDEITSVSFVGKEPKLERVHGDQGQGQSQDQDQDQDPVLEFLADSRLALGEEEYEYDESAYDSISEDETDYAEDVADDVRFGREDDAAAAKTQEYVYENLDPASGKQQRPVAGESQTPTFFSNTYAAGGHGGPTCMPGTGRQSEGGLQQHPDLRQYFPLRPHIQQQQQQQQPTSTQQSPYPQTQKQPTTTTTTTRKRDSTSMGCQDTNGLTPRQQQYQQPPPTVIPAVKLPPSAFMHHGPAAAAAAAAAVINAQRAAMIPSVPAASNTISSPTTPTTTTTTTTASTTSAVANQVPSQVSVPPSFRMLATIPPSQATFVPSPGSTTSTLSAGTMIPTPTSSSASSPSSFSSPLPSTSTSAPHPPASNSPATTVAAVNKKIDYRLIIKMHNMARRGSRAPSDNHSITTPAPNTIQYRIMAHGVPTRDEMRSVALRYISEIFDLVLSPYQPAAALTLLVGGVDHTTHHDTSSLSNTGTLISGTAFHNASSLPAPTLMASYALATSTTAGLFTDPANTTTAGAGGSTYHQGGSEGTMSFIRTVVSRVSFTVDAVLGTQEVYDLANYGEDDFGWLCESMAKRVSGGGNGMAGGEKGRDGPWALPLFEVVCTRIWM